MFIIKMQQQQKTTLACYKPVFSMFASSVAISKTANYQHQGECLLSLGLFKQMSSDFVVLGRKVGGWFGKDRHERKRERVQGIHLFRNSASFWVSSVALLEQLQLLARRKFTGDLSFDKAQAFGLIAFCGSGRVFVIHAIGVFPKQTFLLSFIRQSHSH